MNKFKKYCPNVWIAECDDEYEKGELIYLETKYGKEVECEVYNLIAEENDKFYYSIVRTEDMTYAERKAEKYSNASMRSTAKSQEKFEAANEGREFLSMGEPIKVGHHSEKRHRALLDRNWKRAEQAIEHQNKAEEQKRKAKYWENKSKEITLAMPESLEYFKYKLEKAKALHKKLKENKELRTHAYSLTYAKKDVNELTKKVNTAEKLWGNNIENDNEEK